MVEIWDTTMKEREIHEMVEALTSAVRRGDSQEVHDTLNRMLAHSADSELLARLLNGKDKFRMTALQHAAWKGRQDIVVKLLNLKEVDVNANEEHGFTALHFASWNNSPGVVSLLLAHPQIDMNVRSGPLSFIVGYRLDPGTAGSTREAPSLQDKLGREGGSSISTQVDDVQLRTHRKNADRFPPSSKDDNGLNDNTELTALHCAAWQGNSVVVETLVEKICSRPLARTTVNALDLHGMSPLHHAVIRGDPNTVEQLSTNTMVRGNVEAIVNDKYLTPLDMASLLVHGGDVREYLVIINFLSQLPDVKGYKENLHRDRQVFVDGANAMLVGAALIASITFAGWLQPPLGFQQYYEERYAGAAPPGTFGSYAEVEQHFSVRMFWIFNSLSFFFAVATVLTGATAVLPSQAMVGKLEVEMEVEHIRALLIRTTILLSSSVVCVLGAFIAAGFASLPPKLKDQWWMIPTSAVGGLTCMVALIYSLRRVWRLFRNKSLSGLLKGQVTLAPGYYNAGKLMQVVHEIEHQDLKFRRMRLR